MNAPKFPIAFAILAAGLSLTSVALRSQTVQQSGLQTLASSFQPVVSLAGVGRPQRSTLDSISTDFANLSPNLLCRLSLDHGRYWTRTSELVRPNGDDRPPFRKVVKI
jgi:hypothetical protein